MGGPAVAKLASPMITAAALKAKAAKDAWYASEEDLFTIIRASNQSGMSLGQIAKAAGCSKTWVKKIVDAKPGERP